MSDEENTREKNPLKALKNLGQAVRPNIGQFLFIAMLVIFCGGILSICKMTQAFMTWQDLNHNGVQDWKSEKGEFEVTGALQSTQFLITYGIAKSISNFVVGVSCDTFGKKPVMLIGWALALVIPLMVLFTSSWAVIVSSNLFLGLQQGLCWSITIFMFIDYCGPSNRGVAVGLNESIGYTAVAIFNVVTAHMVHEESRDVINYRREPYYILLAFCILGFFGSLFYLKDTKWLIETEIQTQKDANETNEQNGASTNSANVKKNKCKEYFSGMRMAFVETTFKNKNLMLCCQVGLMINFMTAFVWGILTKWLKSYGNSPNWEVFHQSDVADVLLTYALTKGVLQFLTGYASDRLGRKIIVVSGMWIAGAGMVLCYIIGIYSKGQRETKSAFIFSAFLLGFGTALLYPNVIAAAAEHADPSWRASAVGTYRFWRDSGYWIGGLVLGTVADSSNIPSAVLIGAILSFISGLLFLIGYNEKVENQVDFNAGLADKIKLAALSPEGKVQIVL